MRSKKDKKDKKKHSSTEIDDPRFQEIKSDPRYLEMPSKKTKVKVDPRFKQMFDKKSDFNTISKFDKTGKIIKQKDKMMQKFY